MKALVTASRLLAAMWFLLNGLSALRIAMFQDFGVFLLAYQWGGLLGVGLLFCTCFWTLFLTPSFINLFLCIVYFAFITDAQVGTVKRVVVGIAGLAVIPLMQCFTWLYGRLLVALLDEALAAGLVSVSSS